MSKPTPSTSTLARIAALAKRLDEQAIMSTADIRVFRYTVQIECTRCGNLYDHRYPCTEA